ncbi:MAG: hypothetical protein HFG86_03350 [Dorea sp.]|nr:hypothetical protein [Dorea sp.]
MFFAIYLLGIIIWILMGVGGGSGNLVNYMDGFTLLFVLVPCILILFSTGSLKAFGRAFLFAFGKRGGLTVSYKESLLAVRMVMAVSAIFGFLGFLIGTSASIRSIKDFSTVESLGWIVRDLLVSMISLIYPLLIWVILLPVCLMLKKYLLSQKP